MLDVYLPEGTEGPVATLFVVHGLRPPGAGIAAQGVLANQPKERLDPLGRYFAERGYAVVLIHYRYPSEPFQQWMTQDALCALAWVHAQADAYGFDTERIAVLGETWGAAIATNLVMVDDPDVYLSACPHALPESGRASAVVTFGGLFLAPEFALEVGERISQFGSAQGIKSDIPLLELIEIFETLRDHPPQAWRESDELDQRTADIARLLSLYWIDDSQVPFLLIDGPKDLSAFQAPSFEMRPSSEAESFAAALREAGVNAETRIIDDASYESLTDPESSAEIFAAIEAFLAALSD
jgi:carboxylesterase type B